LAQSTCFIIPWTLYIVAKITFCFGFIGSKVIWYCGNVGAIETWMMYLFYSDVWLFSFKHYPIDDTNKGKLIKDYLSSSIILMKNLNIWEEVSFLSLWKFCGLKVWTKVHVKCLVIIFNFIWIFLLLGVHYVVFGRRCLLIQPTKLFVNVDKLMLVSLCGKKVEAMHWLNIFNMWSGIMNYKVVHIYIYIYIMIIYCITPKGYIHDLYIFVIMIKF